MDRLQKVEDRRRIVFEFRGFGFVCTEFKILELVSPSGSILMVDLEEAKNHFKENSFKYLKAQQGELMDENE